MNKLTWNGHATLGLETGGHKLLIDPFFTGNPAASTTADTVSPDFILVSHGHGGNPCGFLLTTNDGKKIYAAQDTGLFGDMRLIGEEELDVAVIPIGDNYTMGPDDDLRAVKMLQPRTVIPIHYNTFDLLSQDALGWKQRVEAETDTKVAVLKPGESFEF